MAAASCMLSNLIDNKDRGVRVMAFFFGHACSFHMQDACQSHAQPFGMPDWPDQHSIIGVGIDRSLKAL